MYSTDACIALSCVCRQVAGLHKTRAGAIDCTCHKECHHAGGRVGRGRRRGRRRKGRKGCLYCTNLYLLTAPACPQPDVCKVRGNGGLR